MRDIFDIVDLGLNLAIILITFIVVVSFFRDNGRWSLTRVKKAFIFYTTLSNVLCAVASICMCVFADAYWAFILKYIGTVAVIVTMLTVIFFLGPSIGNYKRLFEGPDLYMHLITPVLAIISFCIFERRSMTIGTAMLGTLTVVLYGLLYLYKILYASENKRWDDFYGFNKNGRWLVSYALMLLGTAIICLIMFGVSKI